MADDQDVLERLDRYARAIARSILRQFGLEHDGHRAEDIAQNLFLAGCQVWQAQGDEGLAKHRMSSRAGNEIRKLAVELNVWFENSIARSAAWNRGPIHHAAFRS